MDRNQTDDLLRCSVIPDWLGCVAKGTNTLTNYIPEERYLFAKEILAIATIAKSFKLRGKVISTLYWNSTERITFMRSELWVLVAELDHEPEDWQAYLYTALMTNTWKYFNYMRNWRQNKPKHNITHRRISDRPNQFGDLLSPPIKHDPMNENDVLMLRERFQEVITSAKRSREYHEQLEETIAEFSELLDTLETDEQTIRFEAQRQRRNFREGRY